MFRNSVARNYYVKITERSYFGNACFLFPAAFFLLVGVVPFVIVALQSLSSLDSAGRLSVGASLEGYRDILQMYRLSVLAQIVRRALLVGTLDVILAIPVGYVLVRLLRPSYRTACLVLFTVPFFSSDVTRAFAWTVVLGNHGLVNRLLVAGGVVSRPVEWFIFDEFAVVVALVSSTISFAIFPIVVRLLTIQSSVWLASADLGISRATEFFGVALPLSIPGIMFGWIACFVVTVGSSAEAAMLGGTHQASLARVISDLESARKLSAVFALCTVSVLLVMFVVFVAVMALRYRLQHLRLAFDGTEAK